MNEFSYLYKKVDLYNKIASNEIVPISFTKAFEEFLYRNNSSIKETPLSYQELLDWININKNVLNDFLKYHWISIVVCITAEIKHNIRSYITISNYPPTRRNEKVQVEAILLPSGRIPKLWFWIVDQSDQDSQFYKDDIDSNINVDLSHNHFILEAIRYMFGILDTSDIQLVSNFAQENKKKIDDIRFHFKKTPQYLGEGADGVAFDIGDKVLKIFRDNNAFIAAKKAMDRLHNNPALAKTEAMIYDVDILGSYYDNNLYYYIMEKMIPVSSAQNSYSDSDYVLRRLLLKIIKNYITSIKGAKINNLHILKSKIHDPNFSNLISKKVDAFSTVMLKNLLLSLDNKDKQDIQDLTKDFNLKSDWLKTFAEEILMKYLTGRTDLHTGNLGITEYGVLRYFDPSYAEHTSNINY